MRGHLPATSRLIDLVHTVPEPLDYFRNVFTNFVSYGYDAETCVIRIGIKGDGIAPNYKIEEPSFLQTLPLGLRQWTFTVTPASIFNGRNHREMVELYDLERRDGNWSSITSSFAELKGVLASVAHSTTRH